MIFLPIVERELRVTARRRMTYWMRPIISLLAIIIGGWIFLADLGAPQKTVGPHIFIGLSSLALVCCLLAGRLTTVDCLSEEKREGTLGLLFLTDLKGYDVVFGKLVATSVNGFFGLLSMFPVLAVTLMMGGIGSGEFWRMVLVLANTFLFSLALGLFASSLCHEFRRSVTIFFLLLLFCSVVLPGVAGLVAYNTPTHMFVPELCLSSPGYTCVMAFDFFYSKMPDQFWKSAALIHGLTWLLVLMACFSAPRSWQDLPTRGGRFKLRELLQRWSYGNMQKRTAFRRRLLKVNPFYWLAARDRLKPHQVWLALSLLAFGWFCGWLGFGDYWINSMVMATTGFILNTLIKLWVLVESGQRLAEERKMGSLELLLTTPLTTRDILRGQRLALQRQFLWPIVAAIAVQAYIIYFLGNGYRRETDELVTVVAGMVLLIADLAAVYWVSLLAALRTHNPNQASVSTLLRLMILPWVLFALVAVLAGLAYEPGWMFYVGLWFGLGVATDIAYGMTAWLQLRSGFRLLAAGRGRAVSPAAR